MIDPVSLAAVTSAITLLGNEFSKGVAGEAGKTAWAGLKNLFGWDQAEPPVAEIPVEAAKILQASPEKFSQALEILQVKGEGAGDWSQIVIHAKNVGTVNNYGHQSNTFN